MSHPLQRELNQFLDKNRTASLQDVWFHFKNHANALEIFIIASDTFAEDTHLAKEFKISKNWERISGLVQSYGDYDDLAKLFVPENVTAAAVYKHLRYLEKAKELIELIYKEREVYCSEVYEIKQRLFGGPITVKIKNFSANLENPIAWLENKIQNQETTTLSDSESESRYLDFIFYKLNDYSSVVEDDAFFAILERRQKAEGKRIKEKKNVDVSLLGHITECGVNFSVNNRGLGGVLDGVPSTSISIRTDIIQMLKDAVKDGASDKVWDVVLDYLMKRFVPGIQETDAIKKIVQALGSNIVDVKDSSAIVAHMGKHYEALEKENITIKNYYVNIFLKNEFETFFKRNGFPFSVGDLKPVFETLYVTYISSVVNIIPPAYKKYVDQGILADPKADGDTIRFKVAYKALFDPDSGMETTFFVKNRLL